MTDIALMQNVIADGGRRMDVDKETVQCVAILGGVAFGVTALLVDGEAGYAVAMGLTNLATGVVAYLFGSRRTDEDEAEVQK